jgi:hypothetical protein
MREWKALCVMGMGSDGGVMWDRQSLAQHGNYTRYYSVQVVWTMDRVHYGSRAWRVLYLPRGAWIPSDGEILVASPSPSFPLLVNSSHNW